MSDPLATLTRAETEVALLAASGKPNVEIAELRGTRPRTIANQLASIYRKLEVHSRLELARLLATPKPETKNSGPKT